MPQDRCTESDQWIISRLNTLVKTTEDAYEEYEPTRAARAIQNFVIDDLSNWYVRLNRKRFWMGDLNENKKAAYQTLHQCLMTIAKIAAPLAPFYMDKLFLDLTSNSEEPKGQSVHLEDFPKVDSSLINRDLEEKMRLAQQISSLVHSLRKQHKIKVRQPLSRILLPVLSEDTRIQIESVTDIIKSEVNVKEISLVDNTSGVIVKKAKPNFRKLGQVYGQQMKDIAAAVSGMSQDEINQFDTNGMVRLSIGSGSVELRDDDLIIQSEDIPGWTVASEGGLTVALDINITEPLRQEGLARDLVNRIQNLRKDMGLDVQDKISVRLESKDAVVKEAVAKNKEYICNETQAVKMAFVNELKDGTEFIIDKFTVNIKLETVIFQD